MPTSANSASSTTGRLTAPGTWSSAYSCGERASMISAYCSNGSGASDEVSTGGESSCELMMSIVRSMRLRAERAPDPAAQRVAGHDQHDHPGEHRRGLRLLEQRQVEVQHLPQPAGADDAQDRRHADVHLPAIQGVADALRRDL